MTYEQVQESRKRAQERYDALSEKDRKFLDMIRAVDVGDHGIKMGEMLKIAGLSDNNALNAAIDFFNYGFLKGQRAARKEVFRCNRASGKN